MGEWNHTIRGREGYGQLTRRPLNNLLLVLPSLVLFQIGAAWTHTDRVLLAPVYISQFLGFFGATGFLLPALLIVVVLVVQHLVHRDPWELRPMVLAGMVGESVVWAIPLIPLSYMTSRLAAVGVRETVRTGIDNVLTAFGAGIYEEFLFRMVLIGVLVFVLVDVCKLRKDVTTAAAVLVSAVVFSLCHFIGPEGYALDAFLFRAGAGVLWGVVFLYRGFAIAVSGHILWDLYVFAQQGAG